MKEQKEVERLVALADAQLNQQNINTPDRVRDKNDEDLEDNELVDSLHRWCANNIAQANQNQQEREENANSLQLNLPWMMMALI